MNTPQEKGTNERIQEWQQKREHILQMGGEKAIADRHEKGQMSARERIEYLFDPGTFTEIGMWVRHRTTAFGMDKREVPAEGIITGFGTVNGRHVVAAAEDFTAMMGTFGEVLGNGSVLGYPVFGEAFEPWVIMILPPGGFFTLGFILLGLSWWEERKKAPQRPQVREWPHGVGSMTGRSGRRVA